MIRINKLSLAILGTTALLIASCKEHDNMTDTFDVSGTFIQNDQMARPAINTVFVNAARKDEFNTTKPSSMDAAFNAQFQSVLTGFGYTTNILMLNKAQFAGVLVTDVLNVGMSVPTTFGTLKGRRLEDDVINTELTLIFGGASGMSNPGLIDDHVDGNDKPFLSTFPFEAAPW
jgi:Domain of unknown function (DUF4331)